MSSVVYYRFRSSKTPQRLTFDGTGISVFDIKRGILIAQKLDTTAETFQLKLSNPDTQEEYTDDSEVLPRSTLVEAKRLPLARPGTYEAASQYLTGSLALNAKNASRREDFRNAPNTGTGGGKDDTSELLTSAAGGGSEQDMMNMMFAQQGAQWSRTQQEMATKTKVYTPRPTSTPSEPDKTLPPGYICHRCGQKGHWITQCPSLYDQNWETKKVLRTTGIPKSMLRAVSSSALEGSKADGEDGRTYLMNADGEYVVAVADEKSWEAFQERQLQHQAKAKRKVPEELQDPITHELVRDPRKMPCCGRTYSDESIENALIQTDFKCPNCGKQDVYIDQLQTDTAMKEKLRQYLAEGNNGGESNETGPSPLGGEPVEGPAGNESAISDAEEDDSDYSPMESRKRRRSSVASDLSEMSAGSGGSDAKGTKAETNAAQLQQPQFNPMMMPFMFNPFLMAMMQPQSQAMPEEDSDYDVGDEQPIVGRIR